MKNRSYFDKVHIWGKISSITTLLVLLTIPLAISVHFNVWPEATMVFKALLKVIPIYWITAVIEVITYAPMLGAGGTYLSFVTGNISNLKLPCGLNAMENAGVRANSEEGEVISTVAIAASAITTTIIIAAGVLLFAPFLPSLRAEGSLWAPAFAQVLPALFGALGAGYFAKHWKISILPIVTGVAVLLVAPSLDAGVLMFITIIAALVSTHIMYKKGVV